MISTLKKFIGKESLDFLIVWLRARAQKADHENVTGTLLALSFKKKQKGNLVDDI